MEIGEDLGVLGHGVGEAGAAGHVVADDPHDGRERRVGVLAAEQVEGPQDRHAGAQEVGQLVVHGGQVRELDLLAEEGAGAFGDALLNVQGVEGPLVEHVQGRLLAVGGQHALDQLALHALGCIADM